MIKLLIGGSPCTYWSIAQKNNRETEASGIGWELFKNYLIAKEKFKPDYFLYENNVSAAKAIKDQIKEELRVWDGTMFMDDSGSRYIEINSALVSAQNRQRFYVHNCGEVQLPVDRNIFLSDILESGESLSCNKKSCCLTTRCNGAIPEDTLSKNRHEMVAERVIFQRGHGYNVGGIKHKKAPTLTANGSYVENNLILEPYSDLVVDYKPCPGTKIIPTASGLRCQSTYGVTAQGYSVSYPFSKMRTLTAGNAFREKVFVPCKREAYHKKVYEVKGGFITIKDKKYKVNLRDGYYIIRKLSVAECARLQTMPDNYCKAVSNSQAYKALGNGWTAEVIMHILSNVLKNVPKDEELVVLSMYDGIATGRYCLEKMGFTNVKYIAYEIDKYPIKIAMSNYPDIIEMGDAFQVRNDDWETKRREVLG